MSKYIIISAMTDWDWLRWMAFMPQSKQFVIVAANSQGITA
jgi:hypothetical protein